jgi:hypothetical protein
VLVGAATGPVGSGAAAGASPVVPDDSVTARRDGLGLRAQHVRVLGRAVDQQDRRAGAGGPVVQVHDPLLSFYLSYIE